MLLALGKKWGVQHCWHSQKYRSYQQLNRGLGFLCVFVLEVMGDVRGRGPREGWCSERMMNCFCFACLSSAFFSLWTKPVEVSASNFSQ